MTAAKKVPAKPAATLKKPAPRRPVSAPAAKKQLPAISKLAAEESQPARFWYWAGLVFASLLLLATTGLALQHVFFAWELRLFDAINGWGAPGWVTSQVAKPLSNAVWGLVGLTVLSLLIPRTRSIAWRYAVPAGAAYATAFVIEHIVDRARPAELLRVNEFVLRAAQDGPGFPSGHVAVLTALVVTLWPFVRWPWRILLAVLVLAQAWSRVFLGVHAPLDVIGGFAVGLAVVCSIRLLPGAWLRRLRLV